MGPPIGLIRCNGVLEEEKGSWDPLGLPDGHDVHEERCEEG